MSNNAPDYENDLVFPPKSADDMNKQERQSDVLISTIEKCERLEKHLNIAVKALEFYADNKTWDCCCRNQCAYVDGFEAAEALRKIKELDE